MKLWKIIVLVFIAVGILYIGYSTVSVKFGSEENYYCFNQINDYVSIELDKLLQPEGFSIGKFAFYLPPNRVLTLSSSKTCGVIFAVKNTLNHSANFEYSLYAKDPNLVKKCGFNEDTANKFIQMGRTGKFTLNPQEAYKDMFKIGLFDEHLKIYPSCIIRFHLHVTADGDPYYTGSFDVVLSD